VASKADLVGGAVYTNGKGTFRQITVVGPEFTPYKGQGDLDRLRYRLIAKRSETGAVWMQYNSTAPSFRAWAKGVATIPEMLVGAQPASCKPSTVHSGVFIHASESLVYQFVGGKVSIASHRKADIPATIIKSAETVSKGSRPSGSAPCTGVSYS